MNRYLVAVLFLVASTSNAADRNIMLLQQLQPAHIETVYILERGKGAVVKVKGFGASTLDESTSATASEFEELWGLANAAELAAYNAKSDEGANMADPEFVTISVGVRGKADFHLKIPVEGHNKSAEELLSRLRRFLGEKS